MIYHQSFNSASGNKYNARFYDSKIWNFHFHKNIELIYVIQGAVNCTINNKNDVLKNWDFGLCLSNEIHSYIPEENTLYWICVFSEDYVHSFVKQAKGKEGNTFKFNCCDSVEKYLQDSLINNINPSFFTLKSCLYAVCDEYMKCVTLSNKSISKTHAISVITDFVAQNYKKDISLSDVANLLSYDYHYVSRYFHSIFNMSFKDFLNTYRLECAMQLLDETDKKLVNIAYESGFQSIRSFNSCFKKNLGISPSEYQKSFEKK